MIRLYALLLTAAAMAACTPATEEDAASNETVDAHMTTTKNCPSAGASGDIEIAPGL